MYVIANNEVHSIITLHVQSLVKELQWTLKTASQQLPLLILSLFSLTAWGHIALYTLG